MVNTSELKPKEALEELRHLSEEFLENSDETTRGTIGSGVETLRVITPAGLMISEVGGALTVAERHEFAGDDLHRGESDEIICIEFGNDVTGTDDPKIIRTIDNHVDGSLNVECLPENQIRDVAAALIELVQD